MPNLFLLVRANRVKDLQLCTREIYSFQIYLEKDEILNLLFEQLLLFK